MCQEGEEEQVPQEEDADQLRRKLWMVCGLMDGSLLLANARAVARTGGGEEGRDVDA